MLKVGAFGNIAAVAGNGKSVIRDRKVSVREREKMSFEVSECIFATTQKTKQ